MLVAALVALPFSDSVVAQPTGVRASASVIAISLGDDDFSRNVKFRGAAVRKVVVVGHPQDVAKLLGSQKYFSYGYCACVLMHGPLGDCMLKLATRAPVPLNLQSLPRRKVVVLTDAGGFVEVFNQLAPAVAVAAGSPPPPPPRVTLPPTGPAGGSACAAGCEAATHVEVSPTGETRFIAGCEGALSVELSTSGAIDLKIGSGPIRMSIPVASGR